MSNPLARGFHVFTRAPWWVHVLATLWAVAAAVLVALIVVAATYVDFVRQHGPRASEIPPQETPEVADRHELEQRFAPVLRYDSRELMLPIRRDAYLSRTQLKEEEGKFDDVIDPTPTVRTLPSQPGTCLRIRGCTYFLDVRGVEPDPPKNTARVYGTIDNELIRSGEHPTVYAHVSYYPDEGQYAVQYWFLYVFNYRLNEHESDWEQITVRLDANKQPIDAFYSEHEGGATRDWANVPKVGDHPVDDVALGSHANYFSPGKHGVRIGCKRVLGSIKECFRGHRVLADVADGDGNTLSPGRYAIEEMFGPVYIGSYGTGNYVILTRKPDILGDPRTRRAWRDPLGDLR